MTAWSLWALVLWCILDAFKCPPELEAEYNSRLDVDWRRAVTQEPDE